MKTATTTTKADHHLPSYLWMCIMTSFSTRANKTLYLKLFRILYALLLAGISLNASANVVYVTPNGAGNHDGTSWANAMTFPEAGNINMTLIDIWAKSGIYDGTGVNVAGEWSIYGGFNGTETSVDQRSPKVNVTVFQNFTSIFVSAPLSRLHVFDGFTCVNSPWVNVTSSTISNCIFDNSYIQTATAHYGYDNVFTDCTFKNVSSGHVAVEIRASRAIFTRCSFKDNQNTGDGSCVSVLGGNGTSAAANFYECIVDHNTTGSGGALTFRHPDGDAYIVNCLFKNNTGGSVVYARETGTNVYCFFNTFTANNGTNVFAVYAETFSGFQFFNNVVWGNTTLPGQLWLFAFNYTDFPVPFEVRANLTQSDVSVIWEVDQSNNIIADPLFNSDFTVSGCSPAINAGAANATGGRTTDLAGNPRIHSSRPDLGCYEFQGNDPVFTTWYEDNDHDGFGNPFVSQSACTQPNGYVTNKTDCNDSDNTTWRTSLLYVDADADGYTVGSATSICYGATIPAGYVATSLGPDCNDSDNTKWRSTQLYVDADGDGYTVGSTTSVCYGATVPAGYVAISSGTDCNDNDPGIRGIRIWLLDADNDGHYISSQSSCSSPGAGYNTTATQSGDCDDNDNTKWRTGVLYIDADGDGYTVGGAALVCYGASTVGYSTTSLGTDCNDNDNTKWRTAQLYVDADGDGYTVGSATAVCYGATIPAGYVTTSLGQDCNDNDNTKWRSAVLYIDADGDGYTVGPASAICYGTTFPTGVASTSLGNDCNDSDPAIHGARTWYLDADNDGHYVSSQSACASPGAGYNTTATQSGDCNDNDNTVWRSASVFVDADGDGYAVQGTLTVICYGANIPGGYVASPLGADCNDNDNTKWRAAQLYVDADGDGYTVGTLTSVCYGATIPAGYVATSLGNDCNDANASVQTTRNWYLDADNDGHYVSFQQSCGSPGEGYNTTATQPGDCDDNDATKWRSAQLYVDADGDGYAVPGTQTLVCLGATDPVGYTASPLGTDCNDNDATKWQSAQLYIDADGDGYTVGTPTAVCYGATIPTGYKLTSLGSDCNDSDPGIHGVQTWYLDADNDGHYVSSQSSCTSPGAGYNTTATQNGDCNDNDATKWQTTQLYADADGDGYTVGSLTTVCYGATIPAGYVATSLGDDCDDNDNAKWRSSLLYLDADGDRFSAGPGTMVCYGTTIPAGYITASLGLDCDDANAAINLLTKWYIDADGDGYGNGNFVQQCDRPTNGYLASELTATGGDCNDANAAINPTTVWYLDADNDGYYTGQGIIACTAPGNGYKYTGVQPGDCDDSDPLVHPGATEICGNGIDDNCNGVIDEECPTYRYYRDADGDSYGGDETVITTLSAPPGGWAAVSGDCNDNDPSVNPGATEICGNGVDDNCNGEIDECTTYWRDDDGDGYGRSNAPLAVLNGSVPPSGYVLLNGDCDDGNPSVHPGATEICGNGIDDNCNGVIDEGCITYYLDSDSDGYGLIYITTQSLETVPPPGYAALAGDCNDNDPSVHPGATEVCNGIDDNCNGVIDEGCITYYLDNDGDGYGKDDATISSIETIPPANYAALGGDCNDDDASIHPGAKEVCGNGIDDNCDGVIDEECAVYTYYLDADGDGYGGDYWQTGTSTMPPPGFVTVSGDCNDNNKFVNPGATETCNGIDDNCDGVIDEGCIRGQLPDFTKPDINGISHHFYGDLAAGKAVVMEFSTGWCPFSHIAEPQISSVYDDVCQGQGNIKLYDIIFENETPGYAADDAYGVVYANHHNATYPVIANSQDVYSDFWYQYSITSIPTFFVVIPNVNDPAKSTVYQIVGALDNLKDSIEHILTSNGYGITPPPSLSITVTGNVCDLPSPVTLTSNQLTGNVWSTGQTTKSITITAPGVYTLSYTAGCGTITKKIYIAGRVTATTLSSSSTTACAGGNGIFSLSYDGEHPNAVLQYSLDGNNWNTYAEGFGGERLYFNQWSAGTTVSFRVAEPVSNSVGLPDCEAYSNVVQIVSQQLPGQAFEITADNNDCSFPKTLTSPYPDNFWSTEETTQSISINSPGYYAVYSSAACGQVYDDIIVNSEVQTWYRDADGDYYGNGALTTESCTQPSGYSPYNGDCDDGDARVYPGAPEICGNGKDDNCDGQIDEGCSASYTFYADSDGDGYGRTNSPTTSNSPTPPQGYAAIGGDCDDNDNTKWQTGQLYVDADGDGYTVGAPISVCYGAAIPVGYAATSLGSDCNDANPSVQAAKTWYRDADGDGYGDATLSIVACKKQAGYVANKTDCNDANAAIGPGTKWYKDADGDGYYAGPAIISCTSPGAGYKSAGLLGGNDCDDNDNTVYPKAPELCDGKDNNCNGTIDEKCPTAALSINDVLINEGNKGRTTMTFTVSLNSAATKKVTVQFTTQNGSALSGSDYEAKSGTVTFNAGITERTVNVFLTGDKTIEPNETFMINLSNPVNATIAKGTAMGTIINDDGAAIASIFNSAKTAITRSVKVSPTPANSILRVELSGYTGNVTLQLISMQGKTLLQKKMQAITNFAKEQINVSGFASGTYLLAVIDDKGNMKTEKVIISH